ncbi:hypothetical protein A8V01_04425 [Novosphingobium guangzhouense]|uniref:Methyltransferase type 11 domain-containing protein n=1 Tax=Novosphingobium guangzhouense TaxID=1850347 RepID=A0A2K2G288_9SPHN|nr:hypothetical protein A8V01_04425 [Novosphingobium guangzhouense]
MSQACTQAQFEDPAYAYWCEQIGEVPRTHRKQWEFCYILQVLARYGMLAPGLRGLGFGVGSEPLAALFAARGVSVLGTDLEPDRAMDEGWVDTAQHAAGKEALNQRGLCPPDVFDRLVDFRFMDMNAIDPMLDGQFDFCWSACAFEHLGSIAAGLTFVERSVDTLKPGGLAVHTTEFNCSSNRDTLDNASTVLFRKRDFVELGQRLKARGCEVLFNFELGDLPLDKHVDLPPYALDNHLKLRIEQWTTTSFGIVVRKAGSAGYPR